MRRQRCASSRASRTPSSLPSPTNQLMAESDTVVGQRRLYYDAVGEETMEASDSDEEGGAPPLHARRPRVFRPRDDFVIRQLIQELGKSEEVLAELALTFNTKPAEIEARYELLLWREGGGGPTDQRKGPPTASNLGGAPCEAAVTAGGGSWHRHPRRQWLAEPEDGRKLAEDVEAALDSFDALFCRRCYIFDCLIHGCSQDDVRTEKRESQAQTQAEVATEPCGPDCWLQELLNDARPRPAKRMKAEARARADARARGAEGQGPSAAPMEAEKPWRGAAGSTSEAPVGRARSQLLSGRAARAERREEEGHGRVTRRASTRAAAAASAEEDGKRELAAAGGEREEAAWTLLEQGLCSKGLQVFGRNSCVIAASLLRGLRTCRQVAHRLAAAEAEKEKLGNDGGNQRPEDVEMLKSKSAARRRAAWSRKARCRSTNTAAMLKRLRKLEGGSEAKKQYRPCLCTAASCGRSACPCALAGTVCEKFCGCSKGCKNKFKGCSCASSRCTTRQCPCFAADRECDPDVCRHCWSGCGDGSEGTPPAKEFVNPCRNMRILLRQHQRVLLGRSDVAGWGAFLRDDVDKNEYLGEYTGELISHTEADKRGKIYDRVNSSFLFDLNDHIMMVAGEHRVGVFAKEKMNAGDEIFYDYHYARALAPSWAQKPEYNGKELEVPTSQRPCKKAQK
eukprot:SM000069S20711  [mRNA]  locus=s69:409982:415574:+ [translate_table: standard]